MKSQLVEYINSTLIDKGYRVSKCEGFHSCFDIVAKKGEVILLIKVFINIEALNRRVAIELKKIAIMIDAKPIVVGVKAKNAYLRDDTLYLRYGIVVVSPRTFERMMDGEFPLIYTVRGNYCVHISPEVLVNLRKKMGLSQRKLAEKVGVSKQSIYRYESSGRISLEIANKIFEILESDLTREENVFSYIKKVEKCIRIEDLREHEGEKLSILKRVVMKRLNEMGFFTISTRAPFDLISKEISNEEKVLSIVSNDIRHIKQKIVISKSITEMTNSYGVCITERNTKFEVPTLKPKDLKHIKCAKEFIELISENT